MILTHGANSISRGGGGNVIGGRTYRTVVMPDGKEWLAENLDYKFDGLVVGSSAQSESEPHGNYFNNDEATYGIDGTYKCGLLYNWPAVKYLDDNKATLCPGWHVPTSTEWDDLLTACGGSGSVAGYKLCAIKNSVVAGFPSWDNPTDDYGFGILPCGRYEGSFNGFNDWAQYQVITLNYSSVYILTGQSGSLELSAWGSKQKQVPLRLVHD